MSRWFRHYAGMMRDEKLVSAAVKSKQPVERVVWVWGAILESAAEIDDGGRFVFDESEAAYFLRADEVDILAIVDALTTSGRIASNVVVKWGDRQFQSDKSLARQSAYRERRRAEKRLGDGKPPSSDRLSNEGDGLKPSRDGEVTPQETETETDIKVLSETSSDMPKSKAKKARQAYSEQFETLWKTYPVDAGMSKLETWKAWEKLSDEDRGHAVAAVLGFKAWVAKQGKDYRTLHACRYLSQRRFEGLAQAPTNQNQAVEQRIPVIEDSPAWQEWKAVKPSLTARDIWLQDGKRARGWYFPTEFPQVSAGVIQ